MRCWNWIAGVISLLMAGAALGQATQPADPADALEKGMISKIENLHEMLPDLETLADAGQREKLAPKLIPLLNDISSDMDKLAAIQPDKKDLFAPAQQQYLMEKSVLGDKTATDRLEAEANDHDGAQALNAKNDQMVVRWLLSGKDVGEQGKVVEQLEGLAKAHPESDDLADSAMLLSHTSIGTPQLRERVEDVLLNVLKGPSAEEYKHQIVSEQKQKKMEGKAVVVSGKMLNGRDFTTANWKGKVVLVDFWATWCGPCVMELPRVKKIYAEYHEKGLEVVGVSNDLSAEELTSFLQKNPDMPWPELFDPAAAAEQKWNSTTEGFGVVSIPTMYVIDRKGILRSVSGAVDFEQLVPKLLAE